jgi:TRAP-type uncharacterized transport system substrate-binding protein
LHSERTSIRRSLQLAFITILIGCGLPARAQDIQYDPPATTTNTLTLITGPIDSTAIQIGSDIASLLNNKLRIFPVVGRGAIQNVADLLSLQHADLVITRTDTLDYLNRKGFADKRQPACIAKLYNEEMMVIAPNSVYSLKDLEGKLTCLARAPSSSHKPYSTSSTSTPPSIMPHGPLR